MNSAKNDDVRIGFRRLSSQAKGVSDIVRDLLDGIYLLVMAKKNGIFLFFQAKDFILFERERFPFTGTCEDLQ